MITELIDEIFVLSMPFITGGAVYALTIAGIYFNSRYRNNKLMQALLVLDQVVIEVVKELNQTVVEEIKKASADGKLTHDEAEQIKHQAVTLVLNRLGADLINALQRSCGPVLSLISSKIEAAVFDCKKKAKDGKSHGKASHPVLAKRAG